MLARISSEGSEWKDKGTEFTGGKCTHWEKKDKYPIQFLISHCFRSYRFHENSSMPTLFKNKLIAICSLQVTLSGVSLQAQQLLRKNKGRNFHNPRTLKLRAGTKYDRSTWELQTGNKAGSDWFIKIKFKKEKKKEW